jgi:hypothetical protein
VSESRDAFLRREVVFAFLGIQVVRDGARNPG